MTTADTRLYGKATAQAWDRLHPRLGEPGEGFVLVDSGVNGLEVASEELVAPHVSEHDGVRVRVDLLRWLGW